LKKAGDSISPYAFPGMTIRAIMTKMKGQKNQEDATAGTAFTGTEEIQDLLL